VLDFACLQEALPQVRWCDASATIGWIRAVKAPGEVEKLRQAAVLAEHGMHVALGAIVGGATREAIASAWNQAVDAEARRQGARLTGRWEYTSVGPLPWSSAGVAVQPGYVIKFDVGCLIDGYSSDCGRTFSFGKASPRALQVMRALEAAFAAGLEVLKPGHALREVHERATRALHRAGFEGFARGHFGHSLGVDTFCEVPPFIGAQADEPIEEGMALAFETPFYLDGEGGFIIEDQFLITAEGAQPAWSLPRGLVELPA
jgi:Xaa-Pro aminopeptidase